MKNPIYKTRLRTDISLWLDSTDALAERISMSELPSIESGPLAREALVAVRAAELAVAKLFAHKAKFAPTVYDSMRKLESEKEL